ncbi:MAG: diadenylate cyclase CdaA [Oscillospiraceae bacterium]|jgi:diadenylate cyclase|nr:diadenylate cyclase CdaA [Oscillospiraceae bacterium]
MNAIQALPQLAWSYMKTVDFGDVLDIAIVAYLIYRVLRVVRKTSAGSVIKGVVLLLAVVWLSSLLTLNVVSYLLGQAMRMGVVVLIVLFQPEIRKFLEQMGSRNLKFIFQRGVKTGITEAGIEYAAAACHDMAKTKTGALIVFEREIGLADYEATGTMVDSSVSVELLKNIFYPNTPLHDGAVIIKDGRIKAAGCMLPMSSNGNLSRDLGMRHKAGIGISERSDAVAVIVSEETGTISVAVDGMLKRHLARETFSKLLRNELIAAETVKKPRKPKLKGNGRSDHE